MIIYSGTKRLRLATYHGEPSFVLEVRLHLFDGFVLQLPECSKLLLHGLLAPLLAQDVIFKVHFKELDVLLGARFWLGPVQSHLLEAYVARLFL